MAPDSRVVLHWSGEDDVYEGSGRHSPPMVVDSDGRKGPSPMESLLLSLAGCMCVDIRMILGKSRVRVDALEAEVEADRAESPPRRFTRIRMLFHVTGPEAGEEGKIERAVELSRRTYCSVFHSLREDTVIETGFRRV